MEQDIEEENKTITALQIAIEQELNREEDEFDKDEQDIEIGLEDLRLAKKNK